MHHSIRGSVAKKSEFESKFYFHRNDYKKVDHFSGNMQI